MDFTPVPSTPPRQKNTPISGPYTPKSTSTKHQHRRVGKSLRTPKQTPFTESAWSRDATPGSALTLPFSDVEFSVKSPVTPNLLKSLSLFLPTPLTVGTGRKPRAELPQFRKAPKSKLLLEKLQAAGDLSVPGVVENRNGQFLEASALEDKKIGHDSQFHASFSSRAGPTELSPSEIAGMSLFSPRPLQECSQDNYDVDDTPRTPNRNPVIEQKPQFEPFFDAEEPVQIISMADLDKIPRYEVPNPFLDPKSNISSFGEHEVVDYSTHMELVNSRTGERKVEVLTEAQRRFKPKKLDFTLVVNTPKAPDYKIANKYVENSIGKNFTMGEMRPKGSLDFEIFKD